MGLEDIKYYRPRKIKALTEIFSKKSKIVILVYDITNKKNLTQLDL